MVLQTEGTYYYTLSDFKKAVMLQKKNDANWLSLRCGRLFNQRY